MTGGNVHYKTPTTSKSGQFTMRSDAATPVKTVDSGQKTALLHSQKKKRYLNLPARQFTDILATISKQNFAQWSL